MDRYFKRDEVMRAINDLIKECKQRNVKSTVVLDAQVGILNVLKMGLALNEGMTIAEALEDFLAEATQEDA